MTNPGTDKADRQESQYEFPYHYLPFVDPKGIPRRGRNLVWGFEYLCYLEFIKELIDKEAWGSVIDVGCGDGRLLADISTTSKRCVGIDLSETAIGFGRAFSPNTEFRVCPVQEIGEKFDVVLSIEVLEHIPDESLESFVKSMLEAVAPGGRCIVSVPSDLEPVHAKHFRHYSEEMLLRQLSTADDDFEVRSITHIYRPSKVIEMILKIFSNKWLTVEFAPLNKLVWKYIQRNLRVTEKGRGRHIVLELSRRD